jgi:hypothetical protein
MSKVAPPIHQAVTFPILEGDMNSSSWIQFAAAAVASPPSSVATRPTDASGVVLRAPRQLLQARATVRQTIVTENTKYTLRVANPWVADRPAGVGRPKGISL